MKSLHELFKLITVLALLFIFSIGCSKDSDEYDGDPVLYSSENGTMKAKFSGLKTYPNNTFIHFEPRAIRIIDNRISVSGKLNGYNKISFLSINFPSSIIEPGVYSESIGGSISEGIVCGGIKGFNEICSSKYWYDFHSSNNEVTLTITQLNEERIEGTFKVVGAGSDNQVNIHDGHFNILRE